MLGTRWSHAILMGLMLAIAGLAACDDAGPPSQQDILSDVLSRKNQFPDYPQAGNTYLSFTLGHGFQVNYLAPQGRAWLWYPGNRAGVREDYKIGIAAGRKAICWRHPKNSYNPVTGQSGGDFACEPLDLSQRTVVSVLPGDPFNLASGQVPYPLDRCTAPEAFDFNRARFSC